MGMLPPLVLDLRAHASQLYSELGHVSGEVSKMEAQTDGATTRMSHMFSKASGAAKAIGTGIALAAVAIGVESTKIASEFESATTVLVTGAGESEDKIKQVREGLLQMAPAVGLGPVALAKAMYYVESAGYHAAAGLQVVKAAAEGAKVGGTDAMIVANGLTTAMTDYAIPTKDAAAVTSKLITTVGLGKTTMGELSTSLSSVLPAASAAGIGLDQVLGAMATMTGEGISAQQASQNLSSVIASMANPTSVQTKEMAQMGLSSIDVAKNLGKDGLTGTMTKLSEAIIAHMGPSGLVLQSSFNQSKVAAASAREMLAKLPSSLQELGNGFLNNTVTQKEWSKALKGQDVLTSNLGKQFSTTAKQANGFSDMLKTGSGSAQTFNAAMSNMTGGTTGLNTALALTGSHADTFNSNVKAVGKASAEAGGHVKGWALTQKDLAVQQEQAAAQMQVIGIKIGTFLIPFVSAAIKGFGQFTSFLLTHKAVLIVIAAVLGGIVVAAIYAYTASMVAAAIASSFVTLPLLALIAVIAVVVAAIIWLIANWGAVTKFLTSTWSAVAGWFMGVGNAIVAWWNGMWAAVGAYARSVFTQDMNFVVAVFTGFMSIFKSIGDGISSWWNGVWSGLAGIVAGAFGGISGIVREVFNGVIGMVNRIIDSINGAIGAANSIGGAVGIHIGGLTHIGSFASGLDRVPGADGAPYSATVHGGEAILSNDMLSGNKPMPKRVTDAVGAQAGRGSSSSNATTKSISMTNNFNTNADSGTIAADLGWLLKRQG